jgi:FMN reductase
MTDEIVIMGICGTYTHESANGHLLKMALDACSDLGAKTVTWDQEENPLPLVGAPDSWEDDNVKSFQELAKSADAYILSSPEYHGTMSGVMKNQLDWVYFDQAGGKVWGVMSTLGGQSNSNTLNHMRLSARWLHGHVIPQQIAVGKVKEAFNEDGTFVDDKLTERLQEFASALVDTTRRLKD